MKNINPFHFVHSALIFLTWAIFVVSFIFNFRGLFCVTFIYCDNL